MACVVVIPQNYEELSPTQRKAIIPICIAAFDRHGRAIPSEWFSKGVAPVRAHLVNIARYMLGDPWCVSELAEVTVHRLWEKHRTIVRPWPARLVLKKAMWVAEEMKHGGWRQTRHHNLDLPLDALDDKIRDKTVVDPTNYADLFERQIVLDRLEDGLQIEGCTEIRAVYQLVRQGYTWQEVADYVGAADLECVKRRFYRWIKKTANRHAHLMPNAIKSSTQTQQQCSKLSRQDASRKASASRSVHRGILDVANGSRDWTVEVVQSQVHATETGGPNLRGVLHP